MNHRRLFVAAIALALLVVVTGAGCAKKDPPAPKPKAYTVSFDQPEMNVLVGEKKKVSPSITPSGAPAAAVNSWSSSDPGVAAVDASGLVSGIAPGSATLSYTYDQKHTATCKVTVAPSTDKLTVLMYHSIVYQAGNELRVPPEKFDAEMKWLSDNGYTALTLDEMYQHMTTKTPFPEKSVVITLDDGYIDNYDGAFPILKKYNLHATIFMITSYIDKDAYLTSEKLKEMSDSGLVSIQCHTVTHPHLSKLSYDQQLEEMKDSKETLENLLGKSVDYIAYPYGDYDQDTIRAAQSLGYKMAFRMTGGTGSLSSSLYEFPRAFVGEDLDSLINAATGHGH